MYYVIIILFYGFYVLLFDFDWCFLTWVDSSLHAKKVVINNINLLIKKLDNKTLCKLIIDIKTMSREKIFLDIKKS